MSITPSRDRFSILGIGRARYGVFECLDGPLDVKDPEAIPNVEKWFLIHGRVFGPFRLATNFTVIGDMLAFYGVRPDGSSAVVIGGHEFPFEDNFQVRDLGGALTDWSFTRSRRLRSESGRWVEKEDKVSLNDLFPPAEHDEDSYEVLGPQ